MPRTKKQELIFSLLMVFFMVYAMVCYNIALNMGGMNYAVFGAAFHGSSCTRSLFFWTFSL